MVYGRDDYRRGMDRVRRSAGCTIKKNFVPSVDPRGKIHTTRIPASARMVNGIISAIAKGLWYTIRRLLNK